MSFAGRAPWLDRAGTSSQMTTNSTFSASTTKGTTVSEQWSMRQAVEEVYGQQMRLPEQWSPERQQRYLSQQASRLEAMSVEMAEPMALAAIKDWTARYGQHPDYETTVGLRNVALANAREAIVRQELYDLIEQDEEETHPYDPDPPLTRPASEVPWDQRWTNVSYRSEPGERLEALAEMVWPEADFSDWFRIKMGYLLAARQEDNLPLPNSPGQPLAAELAAMVYEDLKTDGYPVR